MKFAATIATSWVCASADSTCRNEHAATSDDVYKKCNIIQFAEFGATSSISTLVAAMVAGDLADGLTKPTERLTIFAPVNSAFEALPPGTLDNLLKPENKATLVDLLNNHVLSSEARSCPQGKPVTTACLSDHPVVKTVAGHTLHVVVDATGKTCPQQPGSKELWPFACVSVGPSLKDLKKQVRTSEFLLSNGVVYFIDGVLLPPPVEERNQPLDLNLTQANRNSCLAAVKKYRPDMKLCNNKYSDMADQQAQYDNIHGPHAYLQTKGWAGTCRSSSVGQCECPKSGGYHGEDEALCFKTYFREGPENGDGKVHGHYTTMMSSSSKCVACGYSGDTTTHNFCGSDSMVSDEVVV